MRLSWRKQTTPILLGVNVSTANSYFSFKKLMKKKIQKKIKKNNEEGLDPRGQAKC
jgi:hypothetical protein